MAHFSEIGIDGKVLRTIVVSNADTTDTNGVEQEAIGAAFCKQLFGGVWKQTSYNKKFRKNFACAGYTYDAEKDAFIPPQPFASWLFDEDTYGWYAPSSYPTDGKSYMWDESTTSWTALPE